MKKTLKLVVSLIILAGIGSRQVRAESSDIKQEKNVLTIEVQKHDEANNESLLKKIEETQKEQVMNFVQRKHFVRDSDYI